MNVTTADTCSLGPSGFFSRTISTSSCLTISRSTAGFSTTVAVGTGSKTTPVDIDNVTPFTGNDPSLTISTVTSLDTKSKLSVARAVPRVVGLVGGVKDSRSGAETRKAAGVESGGWRDADSFRSGFDGVAALPVLGLGGRNLQAHFLAHGTREEPTNRMGLPPGGFHESLERGPIRPFQKVEDLCGLTAVAGGAGLFAALRRF